MSWYSLIMFSLGLSRWGRFFSPFNEERTCKYTTLFLVMHIVEQCSCTLQLCDNIFFCWHKTTSPSQHVSLMTVALHVTMTCLDFNKRQMLGCQVGDVIVRLLVKLILLWVWRGEVGYLAIVLKAAIVFSVPCPVQVIYMTANICQSGESRVLHINIMHKSVAMCCCLHN